MLPNYVEIIIATGPNMGELAMLPRIPVISLGTRLPFHFKRV